MKMIKSVLVSIIAAAGVSQAATVTLAPGFGTGILVNLDGVQTTYDVTIGGWDGTTFTQFGTAQNSFGAGVKLGGNYAADAPTSLNNAPVFVRIETGGAFGIFGTGGAFPSDVTNALLSSSASVNNTGQLTIASFGGSATGVSFTDANNISFVAIPEPSIALLGGLGLIGLLRRRR